MVMSPEVSLHLPQLSLGVQILWPGLVCSPTVSLRLPQFNLGVQII
jgi:hypothetical protein